MAVKPRIIALLIFIVGLVAAKAADIFFDLIPEVLWRVIYTLLFSGLIAFLSLAEPISSYLRRPKDRPFCFFLSVLSGLIVTGAAVWLFLLVGFPSSEGYVARVLQNKVKKWLDSSHSQFKALPQLDEYYFRYLVTFRDKMEMDVLLPKGSETICFGEDLELDTWSLKTLKMCTQREKAQFFSAVRGKLAESNKPSNADDPLTKIKIRHAIPIQGLDKNMFYVGLNEAYLYAVLVQETVHSQLEEILRRRDSQEQVTPENVEEKIKKWSRRYLSIHPLVDRADRYFGYAISASEGLPINVSRDKNEQTEFLIVFQVNLPPALLSGAFEEVPEAEREGVFHDIDKLRNTVRDFCIWEPTSAKLEIFKCIPITALTEFGFTEAMADIQKEGVRVTKGVQDIVARRSSR